MAMSPMCIGLMFGMDYFWFPGSPSALKEHQPCLRHHKHQSASAGRGAYFVPGTNHPLWAPGLSESARSPAANDYKSPWPALRLPGFLISRLLTSLSLDWISQSRGQCMDSLRLQPQLFPAQLWHSGPAISPETDSLRL